MERIKRFTQVVGMEVMCLYKSAISEYKDEHLNAKNIQKKKIT